MTVREGSARATKEREVEAEIVRAADRLQPPRSTEGRVGWRMDSAALRDGDWHEVSYDIDEGWGFHLAPIAANTPDRLVAYADDARDLGYALYYLMGSEDPFALHHLMGS